MKSKGQSLIELTAGLMILIPIVLLCIDCGTLFLGLTVNNSACRDACRAAAAGQPGQLAAGTRTLAAGDEPYKRSATVVRKCYKANGAIRLDPNITVTETIRAPVPAAPYGGAVDGEVTVETQVDIYPPFLIGYMMPAGVILTTRQTFPYTWHMDPS